MSSVLRTLPPAGVATVDEPSNLSAWRSLLAGALLGLAVVAGVLVGRSGDSTPEEGSAEAGFARDMSAHHEQAVTMALVALERTADPAIAGLAKDIMLTQQNQIGQMFGWLDVWGLPLTGSARQMAWMGHSRNGRMPGMASPEELAKLTRLSGPDLDREFLRLMIRHHEGGVPMAEAILQRSDSSMVRELAGAIVASQQTEVAAMQQVFAAKTTAAAPSP